MEVKLVGDGKELYAQLAPPEGSISTHLSRFTLKYRTSYFLLSLSNGSDLGHLGDKMTRALSSIQGHEGLELEAVAHSGNLCDKIAKVEKSGHAHVHVDINIYGPESVSNSVGNKLSEHKVWLQRPDFMKHVRYENPHVIRFPDVENSLQHEDFTQETTNMQRQKEQGLQQLVLDVENSTHRAAGLERVTGDQRLRTKLLQYVRPQSYYDYGY